MPTLNRSLALLIVCTAFRAVAWSEPSPEELAEAQFRVSGAFERTDGFVATTRSGVFSLDGDARNVTDPSDLAPRRSDPEGLTAVSQAQSVSEDCLCGPAIFLDDFESGDTSRWSSTEP